MPHCELAIVRFTIVTFLVTKLFKGGYAAAGCVDEHGRCRSCKLASVRCINGACCHAPVACGCVDMTGRCCPGGWKAPCHKAGFGCLTCLTCGTIACKHILLGSPDKAAGLLAPNTCDQHDWMHEWVHE